MIYSYKDMKQEYNNIFYTFNLFMKFATPEIAEEYKSDALKKYKADCRSFYRRRNKYYPDPLSVPIHNNRCIWRTVLDSDGECGTDFIIIPDNGQTEEDIKEFVRDTVYCETGVDFDCSGRRFTRYWSSASTPVGIAIVHRWAIDI